MGKSTTKAGPKRSPFYADLPVVTIREIRRRVTLTNPQWLVVADAVAATKGRK